MKYFRKTRAQLFLSKVCVEDYLDLDKWMCKHLKKGSKNRQISCQVIGCKELFSFHVIWSIAKNFRLALLFAAVCSRWEFSLTNMRFQLRVVLLFWCFLPLPKRSSLKIKLSALKQMVLEKRELTFFPLRLILRDFSLSFSCFQHLT